MEEEYDGLPQREGIVELVYDECQEPIAPGSYRVSVYLITLPPLPPIRFTERDDKGHLSYHSYFVKPEGRIGQILVRRLNDKDIWNKEYSLLRGENGGLVGGLMLEDLESPNFQSQLIRQAQGILAFYIQQYDQLAAQAALGEKADTGDVKEDVKEEEEPHDEGPLF